MQPYNYNINAPNLAEKGMQGFAMGQQIMAKRAAQERQAQMQEDLGNFAENETKTSKDYEKILLKYPEMTKQIDASFQNFTTEQKKNKLDQLVNIYMPLKTGDIDTAKARIEESIDAYRNSGNESDAKNLETLRDNIDLDPKGVITSTEFMLYRNDPDKFKFMMDRMDGLREEARTQASKTLPDGTTIFTTTDQNVIVKDASNRILEGQEAIDAIKEAEKFGIKITGEKAGEREQKKLEMQKDMKAMIAEQVAKGTQTGKSRAALNADIIDRGYTAAEAIPTLRRSIEMLDYVKTGTFQEGSRRIKSMFGVEGANEGELSYNLGMSVLAQLKPIFGAAFTAREGESLMKIAQGFGKSAAKNKRVLQQILNLSNSSAKRAIRRAKAGKDYETAEDIKAMMEQTLDPEKAMEISPEEPQGLTPEQETRRSEILAKLKSMGQ